MKIYLLIAALFVQLANAKELRHFNVEVLGKNSSDSLHFLAEAKSDAVEPVAIQVDLKKGKYDAATIKYPNSVTLEQARESLNGIYKRYEKASLVLKDKAGMWRNEDKKFAIQLSKDDEGNVQIIFLRFQPLDAEFWEKVSKAQKMIEEKQENKK